MAEKAAPSTTTSSGTTTRVVSAAAGAGGNAGAGSTSGSQFYMYLNHKHEPQGPAHAAELQQLIALGVITRQTLVWSQGLPQWVPIADVDGLKQQLPSVGTSGTDREKPAEPRVGKPPNEAHTQKTSSGATSNADGGRKRKRSQKPAFKQAKENTWIYITGLPPDATIDELAAHFRKCGIIKEDFATKGPKVKLYRNADGTCKVPRVAGSLAALPLMLTCTARAGGRLYGRVWLWLWL